MLISFLPSSASGFILNTCSTKQLLQEKAGFELIFTSQIVSSCFATSKISSASSSSAVSSKKLRYSKSVFPTHSTSFSLSPINGSGMSPLSIRSRKLQPGTVAFFHSLCPTGLNSQFSHKDFIITISLSAKIYTTNII